MSKNGHNPHDLIAARIVAGAMEASKLPPAAARAVFRALGAAGAEPPKAPPEAEGAAHAERPADGMQGDVEAAAAEIGNQIAAHQSAITRSVIAMLPSREIKLDTLKGYDHPPSSEAVGYREFELDGCPIIRFFAPEVAIDEEGGLLVNLRYRVAP